MESQVLTQLAEALAPIIEAQKGRSMGVAYKHDISGGATPGAVYTHGPGGLLTFPGVDPQMFSTVMGQRSILDQIPTTPSLYTNPTYYTITGVKDTTGAEKDDVCDDAPVAGLMKACLTTSVFGMYDRMTNKIELSRLGARIDRADPIDLSLVNSPLATGGPFQAAGDISMSGTDLLTNEVSRKFWEQAISFHRLLAKQVWVGTPANNSAGGGYKEMTGLETLINTGHVDIETGVACPAVDSDVRSFGYGNVDGAQTNLIEVLVSIYHNLKIKAQLAGVAPVRWVLAMRPELFYEITSFWPCTYLSFRCMFGGDGTVNQINAQDAVQFRDEMRAGSYLLIDGDRLPVVVDDGIPEDSNTTNGNVASGCFSSDIYFVPMSVVGGQSVLFMEYFQYQNPSITSALGNMVLGRVNGAFLTWPKQTNQCLQWQSQIQPRLVLRTPWLAARLEHVVYCPIQHSVESFPTDPYFVNGGRTSREGPSYYSLWQS